MNKNLMIGEIEQKLEFISSAWRNIILEYKMPPSEINFGEEERTNYLGDMLGYFSDTIEIAFSEKRYSDFTDKFSFTISLLQAIYVQQDLIEEMLRIFKTKIVRGDLDKDDTYRSNRDIRNELVGHPINRESGKLKSSALFGHQHSEGEITYSIYHECNNFRFQLKSHKISDIQERHSSFLLKYLDKICQRCEIIVEEWLKNLNKHANFEKMLESKGFHETLTVIGKHFTSIFKCDKLYNEEILLKIYECRSEHMRYQHFINKFLSDLKEQISEISEYANSIFRENTENVSANKDVEILEFEIVEVRNNKIQDAFIRDYHYELSKLYERKGIEYFRFTACLLKSKWGNNHLVLQELDHMEQNFEDEIEYFTALELIRFELKGK